MSKKTLKIGLVTGEFPPMEGGVGAFTYQLGRKLIEAGHEVHILTSRKAKPARKREPSKTMGEAWQKIYDINEPILVDEGFHLHARFRRWNRQENSTIADIAIRHNFDVVNIQYQAAAHNMGNAAINSLPWRLKWVVPTIVTFHDLKVPYLFPKAGRIRDWVVSRMGKTAAGAIVTNQEDFNSLSNRIDTSIANIPIGSNIPVFPTNHIEIEEIRKKHQLPEETFLIGYFGFLHPSKGADDLVESLNRLPPNHHLLFIGGQTGSSDSETTGSFQQELKKRIDQLGLNKRVHWTGFVPEERVSAYLSAIDCVALPYKDGVSLRRGSLMAAMVHGRPIVSTDSDQVEAILVDDQNISLSRPSDPESLAGKIQYIADHAPFAENLGDSARQTAKMFDWQPITDKTTAFYLEQIENGTRRTDIYRPYAKRDLLKL